MKFFCRHKEGTIRCEFPCLELEGLKITIISRHSDRQLRERRHENVIEIRELTERVIAAGDGHDLLKMILRQMTEAGLTPKLEKV